MHYTLSLVGALWIDLPVGAIMQQLAGGVGKVSMLTTPVFVLAGAIMAEGGMARRLVDFAAVVLGSRACGADAGQYPCDLVMSGISRSSAADTSAIGSVMIPRMAAKGYPRVFRNQRDHQRDRRRGVDYQACSWPAYSQGCGSASR